MPALSIRQRLLPLIVFSTGVALVFGAAPTSANTLPAVELVAADPDDAAEAPADALGDQRELLAFDELLVGSRNGTRISSASTAPSGTTLEGAPLTNWSTSAHRIVQTAVTAAGTLTDPYDQIGLTLSLVNEDEEQTRGRLQLASQSDFSKTSFASRYAAGTANPTTGRTYVALNTYDTPSGAATAALAGGEWAGDPVGTLEWNGTVLPSSGEWTVLDAGVSSSGSPLVRLVQRFDGTCLGLGTAPLTTAMVACEETSSEQRWDLAGGTLRNDASGAYLEFGGSGSPALEATATGSTGQQWQWAEVAGTPPMTLTLPAGDDWTSAFDLAVGDVDNVADADFVPDDEAVVVRGENGKLAIDVVRYSSTDSTADVTTVVTDRDLGQSATGGLSYGVAANIADLDGDGADEIVASYVGGGDSARIQTVVARFETDAAGTGAIVGVADWEPVSSSASLSGPELGSMDVVVADLDGDGAQELVASSGVDLFTADLVLEDDGSPALVRPADLALGASGTAAFLPQSSGWRSRLRLETGVLRAQQADAGPVQLAALWTDAQGAYVETFAVTETSIDPAVANGRVSIPVPTNSSGLSVANGLSMAVGGFVTNAGGDIPLEGIAVSLGADGPTHFIQPQLDGAPATGSSSDPAGGTLPDLTAWDPAGESLVVGDPVVFTVEDKVSTGLVAGQPPTHSDWFPDLVLQADGTRAPGFLNVSRNQDFSLTLGDSTTTSYQQASTSTTTYNLALALSANVSDTVDEGVPLVEDVGLEGTLTAQFNAAGEAVRKRLTSEDSTSTLAVQQATQDDDIVNATIQDFTVYRYPVLSRDARGVGDEPACPGGCYGYWDVTVPGAAKAVKGDGRSFDWFQPPWQSGNALSYPSDVDGTVPLADEDLGTYTYTSASGAQTSSEPLLREEIGLGGSSADISLKVGRDDQVGTDEQNSGDFSAGGSISADVQVKAKIPVFLSDSVTAGGSFGINGELQFVGDDTSSTTTSHAGSFSLAVPAIASTQGYDFATAYYYDSANTPTIAYATGFTDNAQASQFWRTYYSLPDPALNLPYASVLTYDKFNYLGTPLWSSLPDRQEIRGFVARQPDDAAPVSAGAAYTSAPRVGDPVVFDVPVSNYSLSGASPTVTVDFSAVPVDADGLTVTGDAVPIGRKTIANPAPQTTTIVSSPEWAAQGNAGGGSQNWRIFVVLDADDTIDEVHDWAGSGDNACPARSVQLNAELIDPLTGAVETLECGQNNQGYGDLAVIGARADAEARTATVEPATAAPTFASAGVLTRDPATLRLTADSPVPQIETGATTRVLLRAEAESDANAHRRVVVYDGDPSRGDVVAVTTVRGVRADGTSVASFRYTPETDGVHELHAVLLGGADGSPDRRMIVRVASDTTETGSPTPTPTSTDAGSGPVEPSPTASAAGTSDLAQTGGDLWGGMLLLTGIGLALLAVGMVVRRLRRPA